MLPTKLLILKKAAHLAELSHYKTITMAEIASAAGVKNGTIVHHFANMAALRRDLLRYAVDNEMLTVIAQALIARERVLRRVDPKLKQKALDQYVN